MSEKTLSLAILGASGHGKVLADMALLGPYASVHFFDDAWPNLENNRHWPVVGDFAALLSSLRRYDGVIVGIGNCEVRLRLHRLLQEQGAPLVSLIHPHAFVSPLATLGVGGVVCAGAVISTDAVIGACAIVNTGASVDHDCTLGDAVHLSPGVRLCGNVKVGDTSWVGAGATVRQGIHIGDRVMVGAGSVVVRNIDAGQMVMGNPARPMVRP